MEEGADKTAAEEELAKLQEEIQAAKDDWDTIDGAYQAAKEAAEGWADKEVQRIEAKRAAEKEAKK